MVTATGDGRQGLRRWELTPRLYPFLHLKLAAVPSLLCAVCLSVSLYARFLRWMLPPAVLAHPCPCLFV